MIMLVRNRSLRCAALSTASAAFFFPKDAAHRIKRRVELLLQPNEFAQKRVQKVWETPETEAMTSLGRVNSTRLKFSISYKLHDLRQRDQLIYAWRRVVEQIGKL
jgi:hypothetical protein